MSPYSSPCSSSCMARTSLGSPIILESNLTTSLSEAISHHQALIQRVNHLRNLKLLKREEASIVHLQKEAASNYQKLSWIKRKLTELQNRAFDRCVQQIFLEFHPVTQQPQLLLALQRPFPSELVPIGTYQKSPLRLSYEILALKRLLDSVRGKIKEVEGSPVSPDEEEHLSDHGRALIQRVIDQILSSRSLNYCPENSEATPDIAPPSLIDFQRLAKRWSFDVTSGFGTFYGCRWYALSSGLWKLLEKPSLSDFSRESFPACLERMLFTTSTAAGFQSERKLDPLPSLLPPSTKIDRGYCLIFEQKTLTPDGCTSQWHYWRSAEDQKSLNSCMILDEKETCHLLELAQKLAIK